MMNPIILHITTDAAFAAADPARGYVDPSLEVEGFIHCSTPAQVVIPANDRFAGRDDLVLLVIDPAALTAELIYEDCYESGMEFPHVYGPIDVAAVTRIVNFPRADDGTFSLPPSLA